VFAHTDLPAGYTLSRLVSYFIIIAAVSSGFISHCSRHVRGEIMDGTVSRRLATPLPYFWFIAMAEISYKYISGIIFSATLAIFYLSGSDILTFPTSFFQWLMFVFSVFLTFVISHLFQYIIGLFAFWLGDIKALQTTEEIIETIFSGRLAPLVFFTPAIQNISNYLPYKYLANVPADIYIGKIVPSEFLPTFLPGIVWVCVLSCLSVLLWHRGLRKHEGYGM
jgi:ABC-2 type transport system permease protein